jgi:hypothetical protein
LLALFTRRESVAARGLLHTAQFYGQLTQTRCEQRDMIYIH